MRRYAIRTFYDGANYYGYQRQPDVSTVEEELIEALIKTGYIESPDRNKFRSASRTDRYVSAIGNVFAFNSEKNIILDQLNASLPIDDSIICWSYAAVDEDFNPKYSKSKKYWYILPLDYVKSRTNMELEEIRKLCLTFVGEHDFRLFCKLDQRDTLRRIDEFNLVVKENLLVFEVKAGSFLWEQIRRIVSYILNYEALPNSLQEIKKLLETDSEIKALNIEPANPEQLLLVEHDYNNVKWEMSDKAIGKIISRSEELLNHLKQKQNLVSSVYDFFSSSK